MLLLNLRLVCLAMKLLKGIEEKTEKNIYADLTLKNLNSNYSCFVFVR